MIITSTVNIEGYEIETYIGYQCSQVVLGTSFLSGISASFTDFFGINSTSYEKVLRNATEAAKTKLIAIAKTYNADAIIGLDIDYTTFTSDLIGVIAGGTLVKLKKHHDNLVVSQEFINHAYYKETPIRIINSKLLGDNSNKQVSLSLYGHSYLKDDLKLLDVSAEIEKLFGNKVVADSLFGIEIFIDDNNNIRSNIALDFPIEFIPIVNKIDIKISRYVVGGQVHVVGESPVNMTLNDEQIKSLQKTYGFDAVQAFVKNESIWNCVCGNSSIDIGKACERCSRVSGEQGVGFDLRGKYNFIKGFSTAGIAYSYLQSNIKDRQEYQGLLEELFTIVQGETRGAPQIKEALEVIQRYI